MSYVSRTFRGKEVYAVTPPAALPSMYYRMGAPTTSGELRCPRRSFCSGVRVIEQKVNSGLVIKCKVEGVRCWSTLYLPTMVGLKLITYHLLTYKKHPLYIVLSSQNRGRFSKGGTPTPSGTPGAVTGLHPFRHPRSDDSMPDVCWSVQKASRECAC